MRHVILTRFNVRLTADAQLPCETWLRHRIELFERFTAPSIAAQSVQPGRLDRVLRRGIPRLAD